ncbi:MULTISPECIES: extracellular solute-binding protein [unclassified Streptomyces]|uniref:extracellular solute-binding protein n=1 Tax=unclassified Streptomyces TaxID=2593676 RepID=UPI0004AFC7E1|nr:MULTISPECIES: extracellular solute-binding protein [unclassified Streptomyces]MYY18171.1 extracellular solute-binding protein [Streptomyces sp. SID4912]SCD27678.1 multiple sugar transport system substrate-binding protein [Streptomyces sp. DpondAA-D4]SCE32114.1 multiple sugar transport system substrate-binding protein [Streptomyces sp. PpalLS-921]
MTRPRPRAAGPAVRRAVRRAARRAGLTLGCLLLLAATACTGGGGDGPPPDDGKDRAADGPLVVASGLDVTGSGGVRRQLVEEWNRRHAGSRDKQAELVELPGDADQQRSQLLGALQSGSARYDVVNLDITWIPEFAEAGLVSPMPPAASEREADDDLDFMKRVHATTVWKGRSYARPFNSDVGLLYYRTDVLTGAGIPTGRQPSADWTWQDLYASVKTLGVSPRRTRDQAGWTTQLKEYEGLTVNIVEAFADVHVKLADADGRYKADPVSLKKGLDALLTRNRLGQVQPAALSSDETSSLADFAAGRAVFLRHWPYAYGALGGMLDPDRYGVDRLPGAAVLGGQNLAVTAGSARAEDARALVRFLTSAESERCLLDAGFAATRDSTYSPGAKACWPRVAAALRPDGGPSPGATATAREGAPKEQSEAARAAYRTTLHDALNAAEQRPRTPYYGAFTHVLQSRVHALLSDETPDTAQAAAELDTALRDAFAGR